MIRKRAIAVENSDNRKTGPVSATYVNLESCPMDCPLMGNGCYAERGMVAAQTARLDGGNPVEIARAEAAGIRRLSGWRPLRLHVSGDCRTNGAARIVSAAARAYRKRAGSPAWTYTHSWDRVERSSWAGVSVLASCDTVGQMAQARARGYATAYTYDSEMVSHGELVRSVIGLPGAPKFVECPHDTKGIPCVNCRLCWDDQQLYRMNQTILFKKK
jgi:hypothetical protein